VDLRIGPPTETEPETIAQADEKLLDRLVAEAARVQFLALPAEK
jgi:hypothetical protein